VAKSVIAPNSQAKLVLTRIRVGDIVGAITKRREDEGNGGDGEDPVVLGCENGRHLDPVEVRSAASTMGNWV
jgi:hypothetical protein